MELSEELSSKSYEFIFVSLDFPNQHDKKLVPFVESEMRDKRVIHMINSDYNAWLGAVSPDWSGSIPATWIVKGEREEFIEASFHSKAEVLEFIRKVD